MLIGQHVNVGTALELTKIIRTCTIHFNRHTHKMSCDAHMNTYTEMETV